MRTLPLVARARPRGDGTLDGDSLSTQRTKAAHRQSNVCAASRDGRLYTIRAHARRRKGTLRSALASHLRAHSLAARELGTAARRHGGTAAPTEARHGGTAAYGGTARHQRASGAQCEGKRCRAREPGGTSHRSSAEGVLRVERLCRLC